MISEVYMKKLVFFVVFSLVFIMLLSIVSAAFNTEVTQINTFLRAGGGSSGSGGGDGGGSSRGTGNHTHSSNPRFRANKQNSIISTLCIILCMTLPFLLHYINVSIKARRCTKAMRKLVKKDSAWKYKNILKTVKNAFYYIQKAWTDMNLPSASNYLSSDLYSKFQTELNWMEYTKEKNILKKIKLLDALPVYVYDDPDNSKDYIWFYIKGKMVDYTINTETNQILSGNKIPASFVEYWQFIRKENTWVLNKILQEDENDQIPL